MQGIISAREQMAQWEENAVNRLTQMLQ